MIDENYEIDGLEIYDEDDDLIDPDYEKDIVDLDECIKMLSEDGEEKSSVATLTKQLLQPLCIFIANPPMKPGLKNQVRKTRPCIMCLCLGSNNFRAFQITTVAPHGKGKASHRAPIINWKRYNLTRPCYINYDHFVCLGKYHVKGILANCISYVDAKNLLTSLKENYEELKKMSYKKTEHIDQVIKELESFIGN